MKTLTNNTQRCPQPSGARKSIFHPSESDVKVLDAMLAFSVTDEMPRLQMAWIATEANLEKAEVQRSIKWLNKSGSITTNGRGRGTHYIVNVENNDLEAVTPESLGDEYRIIGGPTVPEIVRAVFNGLNPLQKVAPKKVCEIAQSMFPDSRLRRQSFGQVFTKMATNGELEREGKSRACKYWRNDAMLLGAAEVPEGFDLESFFQEVVIAAEPTTTTEETQNAKEQPLSLTEEALEEVSTITEEILQAQDVEEYSDLSEKEEAQYDPSRERDQVYGEASGY